MFLTQKRKKKVSKTSEREKKESLSHLMFTFGGIQIFSIVVIFTLKMNVSLLQRCELILEVKSNMQNKILNTC